MKEHRADFPCLSVKKNGKPVIYFDNVATTLKPQQVIDAMNYYYTNCCANVHRGIHKMSEEASGLYERSRETVSDFLGVENKEVIFTKNATESINLVAHCLCKGNFLRQNGRVLTTTMEHHSNMVPWQAQNLSLGFIKEKDYALDIEDLKEKIKGTNLLSIVHVSNTTGAINNIKEAVEIAHDNDCLVLVDSSQGVPHINLNLKELDADFVVFSAHKMLGPTGVGVLAGKEDILNKMPPFLYGGNMIKHASYSSHEFNVLPYKFEAGTPNIAGIIGFGAAIDYLKKVGMENIREHEQELLRFVHRRMKEIPNLNTYGPSELKDKISCILFDIDKMDSHDIAYTLDQADNIAIRSGMHCSEPFVSRINPKGLARASFYFYNTKEEINVFLDALEECSRTFSN
ncbi:SufS family cysteine desulfurase [Candidatus Woesearchaeota archaeon]|nr:SufS family cysteine desulfurase [Candidatus Woesearchaeota archaeon]